MALILRDVLASIQHGIIGGNRTTQAFTRQSNTQYYLRLDTLPSKVNALLLLCSKDEEAMIPRVLYRFTCGNNSCIIVGAMSADKGKRHFRLQQLFIRKPFISIPTGIVCCYDSFYILSDQGGTKLFQGQLTLSG